MNDGDTQRLASTIPGMSRYGQIAAQLQHRIVAGDWAPGEAIPAEGALAREFAIALGTIRQAIAVLVQEGLLERVQGRGTFVRNGLTGASLMRFFRFGRSDGTAAEVLVPRSEILSCRAVRLDKPQLERFGLPPGSRGLAISRRRWVDDKPGLLESIWLPLPRCEALQRIPKSQWGDLLYPLMAREAGITVHRAIDEVTFRTLDAEEAGLLGLSDGHPCAAVTRHAFDLGGSCVEYRVTRGDAYAFRYSAEIR